MSNLGQVSPKAWKRMLLTTKMSTYAVMDGLKNGEAIDEVRYGGAILELIEVEWVDHDEDGKLCLTEDGLKHLLSF